ncbi:hypothetical protein KAW50_02725 [candidate division WOR-3 bacterium]|nr:hypothetical protein [candidate division WOR-3 bacterium]
MESKPNQKEIIYLAGLLDGEGCFTIDRYKNPKLRYNPKIVLQWTENKLSGLLREKFGGDLHKVAPRKDFPNRKPQYRWQIQNNTLRRLLPSLIPFLKVKHRQARILDSFFREKKSDGYGKGLPLKELDRRERLYQKIRTLNS